MQWRLAKLQFTAETKVFHCAAGAGSQAKLNLQNATRSARPRISKDFQDSISMIPTANCTKAVIVRPISVKSLNQSETAFRTLVSSKKVPAKCKSLIVEINQSINLSINLSIYPSIHPSIHLSSYPSICVMYIYTLYCICISFMSIPIISKGQEGPNELSRMKKNPPLHEAFVWFMPASWVVNR